MSFSHKYEMPQQHGYTIYSKSGCAKCKDVKNLLTNNFFEFTLIDCDEYLIEDKEDFLEFIKSVGNIEDIWKTFPIVFFNGNLVGGYKETENHIKQSVNLYF